MKFNEGVVKVASNPLLSDWGHESHKLKYEYKNEYSGEVKKYKMNKDELEEYLKKFNKK